MSRDKDLIVDNMANKKEDQKFHMILFQQTIREPNQTPNNPTKLVFPILTGEDHKNAYTDNHC